MGIYNRNWYREWNASSGGLAGTPVVKYLILANIAVFLLQLFCVREVHAWPPGMEALRKGHPEIDKALSEQDPDALPTQRISIVQEWFELDTNKTIRGGQIWRLLTHAFCHDRLGIYHIFINMLCLYWFGSTLEWMFGSREFLLFYLAAAVVAGLAFVGLDLYTGSSIPGIGASGAVMAVMMLYTMHFPCETIYVCWFFPLEMRWLMAFFVIWDLHPILLALSGDQLFTGIAHSAHLGGLAFGFLYAKYEWRLESLGERIPWPRWKARPRPRLARAKLPEPTPDPETFQVDQVLQKIFESGQESLTDEERLILQQASERMKNRVNRDG